MLANNSVHRKHGDDLDDARSSAAEDKGLAAPTPAPTMRITSILYYMCASFRVPSMLRAASALTVPGTNMFEPAVDTLVQAYRNVHSSRPWVVVKVDSEEILDP